MRTSTRHSSLQLGSLIHRGAFPDQEPYPSVGGTKGAVLDYMLTGALAWKFKTDFGLLPSIVGQAIKRFRKDASASRMALSLEAKSDPDGVSQPIARIHSSSSVSSLFV